MVDNFNFTCAELHCDHPCHTDRCIYLSEVKGRNHVPVSILGNLWSAFEQIQLVIAWK